MRLLRVILVSALVVLAVPQRLLSQTTAADRWEYGSFRTSGGINMFWSAATGEATNNQTDLQSFIRGLGGDPAKFKSGIGIVAFFNILGEQRWELVGCSASGDDELYLFKRRLLSTR